MDNYRCLGCEANMNMKNIKGGLISDFVFLCSNLQKWVPNHNHEHSSPKEQMVRIMVWYPVLEIFAKFKNLLRLSHLYKCCHSFSHFSSPHKQTLGFFLQPLVTSLYRYPRADFPNKGMIYFVKISSVCKLREKQHFFWEVDFSTIFSQLP